MVVVEYLYEDMKRLVDLPLEKMVNGLSELGAPSEYEAETKKIISELTPNRPDWYSMEGLARALKAYYKNEHRKYKAEKSDYVVIVEKPVEKYRPHTACAVVKGLKLSDERIADIVLLQEKLLGTLGRKVKRFGIGIYPLEAIGFPVRYTAMKPEEIRYVPLGMDKEMDAMGVLSAHKKGLEYGHIIRGFPMYPVFIDSRDRIMALVPIVNSEQTGKVGTATKDIFIEVSGMDIHSCKAALNILVCTFADMGGKIHQVTVKRGDGKMILPDLSPKEMDFDLDKANKLLGIGLKRAEAMALLVKMDYGFSGKKILIPPYRADVMDFVDIIEDIAIAYGYNDFKPTLPDFFSPGNVIRDYDQADSAMRGMGFCEIKTFILTNKRKLGKIGFAGSLLEISNPSSEEYTVLRPNLVADMLEVFSINKMKGLPQRLYELGIVQEEGNNPTRLIFAVMDKEVGFSGFRGYLQTLGNEIGMEFKLEKKNVPFLDSESSCRILAHGKEVGVLGRVREDVADRFDIKFEVYLCEMEIERLLKSKKDKG